MFYDFNISDSYSWIQIKFTTNIKTTSLFSKIYWSYDNLNLYAAVWIMEYFCISYDTLKKFTYLKFHFTFLLQFSLQVLLLLLFKKFLLKREIQWLYKRLNFWIYPTLSKGFNILFFYFRCSRYSLFFMIMMSQ